MKRDTFRGYFDPLLQHVSSGTLLDIGCATGELMELAKEMGFDVYGVEISPEGYSICNKKFGEDRIIKSSLKAGDFPSGFFDVITLCDVLEHITEPKVFLEIINDILKPNGLLMIVTPDTSSWACKIMGMRWPHYKEEHVYYYNQSNLVKLLSPNFSIVILKKAYKRLTLNYVAHILQTYSHSRVLKAIAFMSQKLSVVIRSHHFNVHIGESYALFRKRSSNVSRR
jgi:2-polyprenyl-3-methyl-5-hydroxy-6-metoxy-1,4-benzoquinol methylase